MLAGDSSPQWEVDVPFDERMFLSVPIDVRADHTVVADWVAQTVDRFNIQDGWDRDAPELRYRLEGQVRLLSDQALAAFLLCPRGLPGDALVEVFVADTDATRLEDISLEHAAALPQRVHSITSPDLGEGRAVSTLIALEDGVPLGQIRHQFLSGGVFVDVTAASTDLGILGACLVAIETLSTGIRVRRVQVAS
ncbi:MAG: hypothetical protein QM630_02810 [Microbacterium sp.]